MMDPLERRSARCALILALGAALTGPPARADAESPLYNATLYEGAPAFGARMVVVYEPLLFKHGTLPGTPLPSEEGIAAAVRNAAAQRAAVEERGGTVAPVIALSLERWPLWPAVPLDAHVRSIADYADVARRFAEASGEKVCLFDVFPGAGRPTVVRSRDELELREEWEAAARAAWKELEEAVDAACPRLYTYYDDADPDQHAILIDQWRGYAADTIAMARAVAPSLPVYPFLWPRFHPGGEAPQRDIPPDYWRAELETVREAADGVVLWGGVDMESRTRESWNPEAPWWGITREMFALPPDPDRPDPG